MPGARGQLIRPNLPLTWATSDQWCSGDRPDFFAWKMPTEEPGGSFWRSLMIKLEEMGSIILISWKDLTGALKEARDGKGQPLFMPLRQRDRAGSWSGYERIAAVDCGDGLRWKKDSKQRLTIVRKIDHPDRRTPVCNLV